VAMLLLGWFGQLLGGFEQFLAHLLWRHPGGQADKCCLLPPAERRCHVEYGVFTGQGERGIDEVGVKAERQHVCSVGGDDWSGGLLHGGGRFARGRGAGGRVGGVDGRFGSLDLGNSVERVDGEFNAWGDVVSLVVVVKAFEDVAAVAVLAGELEQYGAILLVDTTGPHPAVAALLYRFDVQAGRRVISGEFLEEGKRLGLEGSVELERLLRHDDRRLSHGVLPLRSCWLTPS